MRPTIQQVLDQGEVVLRIAQEDEEDFLEGIAAYSALFEQILPDINSETQRNPEIMRRLSEVHAKLLDRAAQAQGTVSQELQALKRKGKGILAYTDFLPRSISTIKTRKG